MSIFEMHGSIAGIAICKPLFGFVGTIALSSAKKAFAVMSSCRRSQLIPVGLRAMNVSLESANIETWQVTSFAAAWHPDGSVENSVSPPKEMMMPGSGDRRRRSTVTFQVAENTVAS